MIIKRATIQDSLVRTGRFNETPTKAYHSNMMQSLNPNFNYLYNTRTNSIFRSS